MIDQRLKFKTYLENLATKVSGVANSSEPYLKVVSSILLYAWSLKLEEKCFSHTD